MWLLVWALVMVAVHVQFQHCRQITITLLKIVETSLIVLLLQLFTQEAPWQKIENAVETFKNYI